MSAGTEALDAAMALHQHNTDACQAANSQKAVCDVNFSISAQQVTEAQTLIANEVAALAVASTQPLPSDKQVAATAPPTPAP